MFLCVLGRKTAIFAIFGTKTVPKQGKSGSGGKFRKKRVKFSKGVCYSNPYSRGTILGLFCPAPPPFSTHFRLLPNTFLHILAKTWSNFLKPFFMSSDLSQKKVDTIWHQPQDVRSPCRVHEWVMLSPMPVACALWQHLRQFDGRRDGDDVGVTHPMWPYGHIRTV